MSNKIISDEKDLPADWEHPDWASSCKVGEWKNHVDERVQQVWDTFSIEQKKRLAIVAREDVYQEDWE